MLTKEQALRCDTFHVNGTCKRRVGPRGGITERSESWRRNGQTQTWKTRPYAWCVPVKWGMKTCTTIWHHDARAWHAAEDCPLVLQPEGNVG